MFQEVFTIETRGRGTYDVTQRVQAGVSKANFKLGLCNLFIHHTSASLIVCENADPLVRDDLERFMETTVPDADPRFLHIDEGDDDMPAHVRTILTDTSLCIPVTDGRCALGTWQGIYVYEHRTQSHLRRVTLTVQGASSDPTRSAAS